MGDKHAFVKVIRSDAKWLRGRNNVFYLPVVYERPYVDPNGFANGGLYAMLEDQQMDCCWGFDKLEDAQRRCDEYNGQ